MIKINLLGEDAVVQTSSLYQVAVFGVSVVLVLLVCFILNSSVSEEVRVLTREVDELQSQLTALQRTTKEVRNLEKKRAELRKKLVVIAKLKRSKTGPVRVLDDLNISLPEKSWVTEIKEAGGTLRILGLALDNQTIAIFMKYLEDSDYFDNVDLIETRQVKWKDVKMKKFTLSADIDYAGKVRARSES